MTTVDDLGALYRRLTVERDAALRALRPHVIDMYRAQLTVAQIVERTGITRSGVYDILRAANVPRARGGRNATTARAAQEAGKA